MRSRGFVKFKHSVPSCLSEAFVSGNFVQKIGSGVPRPFLPFSSKSLNSEQLIRCPAQSMLAVELSINDGKYLCVFWRLYSLTRVSCVKVIADFV